MPLRLLGAGLSGLCFVGCGFVSAALLRRRLQGTLAACEAVRLLEGQICRLDVPFAEAVQDLGGENPLLEALGREADPLEEGAWQRAALSVGLAREDLGPLLRLRRAVPRLGRGDVSDFELCRQELELRAAGAKRRWEREGVLHKKLGALLGAAAFMLLC